MLSVIGVLRHVQRVQDQKLGKWASCSFPGSMSHLQALIAAHSFCFFSLHETFFTFSHAQTLQMKHLFCNFFFFFFWSGWCHDCEKNSGRCQIPS